MRPKDRTNRLYQTDCAHHVRTMKQNGHDFAVFPSVELSFTPVTWGFAGGPGRTRTDDTRGVNAMLYQLSYRPQTNNAGAVSGRLEALAHRPDDYSAASAS